MLAVERVIDEIRNDRGEVQRNRPVLAEPVIGFDEVVESEFQRPWLQRLIPIGWRPLAKPKVPFSNASRSITCPFRDICDRGPFRVHNKR